MIRQSLFYVLAMLVLVMHLGGCGAMRDSIRAEFEAEALACESESWRYRYPPRHFVLDDDSIYFDPESNLIFEFARFNAMLVISRYESTESLDAELAAGLADASEDSDAQELLETFEQWGAFEGVGRRYRLKYEGYTSMLFEQFAATVPGGKVLRTSFLRPDAPMLDLVVDTAMGVVRDSLELKPVEPSEAEAETVAVLR